MITSQQMRAARALLGIDQKRLADIKSKSRYYCRASKYEEDRKQNRFTHRNFTPLSKLI